MVTTVVYLDISHTSIKFHYSKGLGVTITSSIVTQKQT